VLTDVRPLQVSAPYRRLFFGNSVAQLGQQMTNVAVAIQVYALTHSSFYVGLVGVFALVPLVALGLYGGAIADAVDRRTLALVASAGLWSVSIALAVQAFAGNRSVWLLYGCIAVQSGFYAINNPARSAMVLAQPRALFPALAFKVYGGGAGVVGLLQSAPAAGAVVAFLFSGWVSRVRRQGFAIVVAVLVYGAAVGGVGLTDVLWLAVAFLAVSGMADMVSAAYRSTILQVAAPDQLRGRLQGVFIVVVAGGPRAGDFVAGSVASSVGERVALVVGGLACIAGVLVATALSRRFLDYDALHPTP
jgi:MFS family permease